MGYIAVDLDGTLAHYESGQWPEIGEPIQPMLDRVKGWLEQGREVRICTARASHGESEIARIRKWLDQYGLGHLKISNTKEPDMDELWDDKAIQVRPNTGQPIVDAEYQANLAETLHIPIPKENVVFGVFKHLEKDSK